MPAIEYRPTLTPHRARSRLREHPALDWVEVLGVPDDEWGQRVVAVVVGDLPLPAARDWVGAVHPRSWAPREVVTVDEMPLLANGKVDRVALRTLAAGAAGLPAADGPVGG